MSKGLVLCGFMGAGKTKLGCLLAGMLSYRFEDLDEEIQKYEGRSIPEIFALAGESAFRDMERHYLERKVQDRDRILSLGGGAMQDQTVTDLILAHNLLIFIDPEFDTIITRIAGNPKRPLVVMPDGSPKSDGMLRAELYPLYEARRTFYNQAHIRFCPEPGWSALTSANKLLELVKEHDK